MKQINKAGKMETNSQICHPRLKSLRYKTAIPFTLLFILATLVPDLIITSVTAAQPDKSINVPHASGKQKVLVLHSYHNMGWTRTIQEGIESVFSKSGIAVEMDIEYMDTLRHPPKDSFAYLEDLYRKKYGHISFDVILLSDNYALEFILSRRDKLFPEVPIVFCGINDFREEQLHGQSGITGVNEELDIKGTIELASRIMPNIKKFLVISDRTPTGLANRRKFERTLSGFSHKVPVFELLDNLTASDLQKHLGKLSPDSAVLLFTFQRDKDGQLFTPPEYFKLIVGSCNVPVFTFWESDSLRPGVIGGVMVSGVQQGEKSAEYALRILKGEPASSLPFIMKSPNVPILNYPLLRQFNIPKEVIPAGVIIRNEPTTLYYRYKTTIWLISFFIISLIFINIILLINIARRKRAEEALQFSKAFLDSVIEHSPHAMWISDDKGTLIRLNQACRNLLHITDDEVVGKYNVLQDTIVVEQGYLPLVKRVFEQRETAKFTLEYDSERLKNLELRERASVVLDVTISPVLDADGRLIHAIIQHVDITERKQAENESEKMLVLRKGVNLLQQSLLAPAALEEKLKVITDSIVGLFDADFCRIWLIQPGDLCEQDCVHAGVNEGPHICRYRDRCLHLLASSGRYIHTDGKIHRRVPFGCYKIGRIASDEEHKFLTNDVQNDPRVHNREWARELGLASFVGYQLRVPGEKTLGVLALFAKHPILAREDIILDGLSSTTALVIQRDYAEKSLRQTLESLRKAIQTTIQVMVSAVETRDPYTAGHQLRVADLARAIATEMGLPQKEIEAIRMAGPIHDIGKLSIPAEILSKPTKLTEIEFSLIKEHSRKGYEILKDVESPWPLAEIVYQHHERMNGFGYPRNLKGDDILMEARIMGVADVVEAMASYRPYRPGLGIEAALEEIEKNRGTFYDNTVADACLRLFRDKGFQLESA